MHAPQRFLGVPVRPKESAITKALTAMTLAQAHPRPGERTDAALKVYPADKIVNEVIQRAATSIATAGTPGWASEISQGGLVAEFFGTLAPLSAAAAIIQQGLQIPVEPGKEISVPARTGAPSTTVSWVGEGEPIAAREYLINGDCVLTPKKFGLLVSVSRETTRRASGEAVVRQLIREDAAVTLDAAYFSSDAIDTATHPGLLDGLTPLTGFAGGDRLALETDLAALSDAVAAAGSGNVTFVTSPKRAARLRIIAPDLHRELTVLPSLAVADGTIIALDAASFVHGFTDAFDIDAARDAVLHMSDDPAPISDSGTADPVRSMYQTDCISFRLLADVAFSARRPNAVAFLEGATW